MTHHLATIHYTTDDRQTDGRMQHCSTAQLLVRSAKIHKPYKPQHKFLFQQNGS